MKFGIRAGDAPVYDPENKTEGSVKYIRYFSERATTLRLLEEPENWTKVWMHFSPSKSREYPCTGDWATCPGHNADNAREKNTSLRYIANAVNKATGYADLYKIPSSIYDDFLRFKDKFGTIKDRDYTVYKSGEGKEKTSYSVDREDPEKFDLSKFTIADHNEALQDVFREVWGALPDEDGYRGFEYSDGIDEPISKDGYLKPLKAGEKSEALPAKSWSDSFPADPPSEPAAQSDEEQQEITEAELRAMTEDQVIDLYKRVKIPVPAFSDKDDLVDQFIAALS